MVCWLPTWNDRPYGSSPMLAGAQHQLARALDRGAELARQRPVGALVLHQDAAVDARARARARRASPVPRRNRTRTASRRAANAARIAETFLMVLPKLIASGRAPASRQPRPPRSSRRRSWSRDAPAAPAPGAPDWPSRRSRSAPAAARAARRGNSLPRGPRRAPGTASPAVAAQGIGRSSGSSHRASFG